MKTIALEARPLARALAFGPWLRALARREGGPVLSASEVRGPAIVLGRSQHAARVVDLRACADADVTVLRRETSGTAAFVGNGRALLFTLALPHASSMVHDATAANLLNRNVRGFLQGFTRAGATAHYGGREFLGAAHRPVAALGFDIDRDGSVLIELIAGFDASVALPAALASSLERSTVRWAGREPAALVDLVSSDPRAMAAHVLAAVAARAGAVLEPLEAPIVTELAPVRAGCDPLDEDAVFGATVPCPIGHCEAARDGRGRVWLGGDVLASRAWLDDVATAWTADAAWPPAHEGGLTGATVDDLRQALERTRG